MTRHKEYGFGSESFNWDEYQVHRPKYPQSIMDRIFEYHKANHSQFDAARDIGTGNGIIASMLAKRFEHVYCSDPNEYNLKNAEKILKSLDYPPGKFSFSMDAVEDTPLGGTSVDLTTMFEAMHWTTNVDQAIKSIAASLKPHGTLALLYYNPRPFFVDNQRAEIAAGKIFDAFELHIQAARTITASTAMPQGNAGLDFVPLPTEIFESGAQRIYINTKHGGEFPFQKSKKWSTSAASRVGSSEKIIHIDDEDWSQMVDANWFRGLMESLQQGLDLDALKTEFDDLKTAIGSSGGRSKILWRVNLVLATRR